ncbi:MAG: DNA-processing protein DprA [Acidobacteriota bacterium]|nr:DNA-processing protein DprA [Acidobacteriota bacterium]
MHHTDQHFFRLGLLLAGGGAAVRRAAAVAPPDEALESALPARGVGPAVIDAARSLAADEARTVLDRVAAAGWRWLVPGDAEYPRLLASMVDPPLGLFVCGELSDKPAVSIVGSRKATPYGLQVARLLGEELGRAGVITVSGMARGVDAEAHRGALRVGGLSWAIWGSGPDRVYPPEHADLAEEVASHGALITEYPPGTPPRKHHFPERNRILAGLSQATVVVEAAARSGALITARLAMEEGREVLAVPGNIFSELSVGPNTLLRVGARPLLTPRDLFDALGVQPADAAGASRPETDMGIAPGEALTADEIAARTGRSVAEVTARLLDLELSGDLRRLSDGRYSSTSADPPGDT